MIRILPLAACILLLVYPSTSRAQSARAAARETQGLRAPPHAVANDSTFGAIDARAIGPASMSGRTAAIDVARTDPDVIYVGAATGGVWKSVNGGITWKPLFDEQPASSIGAIALFQLTPDIVWVGTGEGNPRNSAGVGRGVWKSLDGGTTWSHVGLAETERITRILTHPTDPDIVWVAALGPAWSDGEQRGVFRTTDGGLSWEKVLYVDASTGAADLAMDPTNPNHLIVAMWDYRRTPWSFRSGGPGGGLHVTWDGGSTWTRLSAEDGLPRGELGRIGVAFSSSRPAVVYALVEAEKSALIRSDDGGRSWRTVNDEPNVSPRPFYYSDIRVDPVNENRVYRLGGSLDVSDDGGRSFRTLAGFTTVHPDHHALWIEPTRGELLIDGNDGGVYISHDRGSSWRFVQNLPFAQYYHISVDMEQPFNIYGGLQDNGSWMGPTQVLEQPGFPGTAIMNHHWRTVGFGDGFAAIVDTGDPDWVYSMSQGGFIVRADKRTGEWKSIRPTPPSDGTELRFNWNAGLAADPFEPGVIYYGSQFVHRTADRGQTWSIISPDLTTNDAGKQAQAESGGLTRDVTAAENHTTILTIAPSTVERGVIWVGTDDGNVQLTRDGGGTWTNVVDRIPGVPGSTWVPHIEASKFDAASAFVVFDNHRRGDWTPYVFRTSDSGRTWTSLATAGIDGFVHVIEQDPVEPGLLFLGSEFGLFVSLDGGRAWRKWTHGVPTVPVLALVVHPRDHDLVIATHGRAAFVLDDVRPLRALARDASLARRPLHVFEPPPAIQHVRGIAGPYYFPGNTEFMGENRPYGALISYSVGAAPAGDIAASAGNGQAAATQNADSAEVQIQILDAAGAVVRELNGPAEPGLHRVVWDLRREPFRRLGSEDTPELFRPRGPEVLPGRYTVRLRSGANEASATLEVVPDPRREVAVAARTTKHDAILRAGATLERATDAVNRLRATSRSLDFVQALLADTLHLPAALDSATRERLRESSDSVEIALGQLLDRLRLPETTIGIVEDRTVASELAQVYGYLASSTDEPTEGQLQELNRREALLEEVLRDVEVFHREQLDAFRSALEAAGIGLFGRD